MQIDSSKCYWDRLNLDVTLKIFQYCDFKSQSQLVIVCKLFKDIIYQLYDKILDKYRINFDKSYLIYVNLSLKNASSLIKVNFIYSDIFRKGKKFLGPLFKLEAYSGILSDYEKILWKQHVIALRKIFNSTERLNKMINEKKIDSWINKYENNQNLKTINLTRLHLEDYPEKIIFKITTKLLLHKNKIKCLPEKIRERKLKYLDLSDNQLVHLEPILPKALRKLNVGNNRIKFISEKIKDVLDLEEVRLFQNPLKTFPNSLLLLKGLKILNLSDTSLDSIPTDIQCLTYLQDLNLSKNHLLSLPESIGKLINLRVVNLEDNKIAFLPNSIESWSNIEELNIAWNQVTEVQSVVCKLTTLKKLNLALNKIKGLPDKIKDLKNVRICITKTGIKSKSGFKLDFCPNGHTYLIHK